MTLLAILTLCAVSFEARAQTIKEVLDTEHGKEFVLTIDGLDYRAITASHAKAIIADKQRLSLALQQIDVQDQEIEKLKQVEASKKQTIKIADLQAQLQASEAEKWKQIALNRQAIIDRQEQLIGRRAWGSSVFENVWVDRGMRFGLSVLNSWWSHQAAAKQR